MHLYERAIRSFNQQLSLTAASYADLDRLAQTAPDGIVAVGMGGSGLVGDLLRYLARYARIPVPVISWKDFDIPRPLPFKRPLYLVISFSGNTAETRDAFAKIRRLRPAARVAVVASGGAIAADAARLRIPRAAFSSAGLVPRQAAGIMLYAALGILKAIWPAARVPDLRATIDPARIAPAGRALAARLAGKTILVYATGAAGALGYHWKTKLNETAKAPAFSNVIPELIHNELVSFEVKPKGVAVLLLTSSQDAPGVKRVTRALTRLLTRYGTRPIMIEPAGADPFARAANALILADWTAYYLALARGVDPQKTDIIAQVKELQK